MIQKRQTPQRKAIDAVFQQSKRPLSIDEVLDFSREQLGSMNPSTVYRNLGRMIDEGTLKRITLPSKGVLYELAQREHHHHFLCNQCDRAFELPGCGLNTETLAPSGYQVENHDVFLYGTCPACTKST